jgi:translation initiation factor IF-2
VAINKIDRPAADVEAVLLDLSSQNMIPEELGGDIICVPVSAK